MALPTLELRCLGAPGALVGGGPAPSEVLWRKHLALLVFLALAPGRRATRARLHALLWPDVDDERARRSLNESVRRLRLVLGRDRLRSSGEVLELAGDGLAVDVLATPLLHDPAPLPTFLEGFSLEDAEPFNDWADAERARVLARQVSEALAHGEDALDASHHREAAAWAAAVQSREPLSVPAAALRMRALALAGETGAALAAYQAHVEAFAALGEPPEPALTALAMRVRAHPAALPRAPSVARPLVGRAAVHRRVFGLLADALAGATSVVAIAGEPGAGKTRLAAALAERGTLEGAAALGVTAMAMEHEAPWSGLRSLLRAGLARLPGLPGASPDALAVLASLVPGVLPVAPRAPSDEGEVAAALQSVLRAVAEERPIVLTLDDAQWVDGASLRALHVAVREAPDLPLLLVLTLEQPTPDTAAALLALFRDLGRRLAGSLVTLAPFTDAEVAELVTVSAPWCATPAERARLARRLVFETGGDPLLCATLLDSLQELVSARLDMLAWPPPQLTLESPLPVPVPVVLHTMLLARLAQLDLADRRILGAAALAGLTVDEARVASMLEIEPAAVGAALVRLERAGFVEVHGEGYRFPAALLATLVSHACLGHAERRQFTRLASAGTRDGRS
ncbi:MAG: AAA family ATPase [Gemmatimonadales bacterium]